MAELCLNNLPQGINRACTQALTKINNIIITSYDDAGFTIGAETTQSTWTGKFGDLSYWMPKSIQGAEETSPGAVEIETANGKKYISFDKPPSMNVMIEVNAVDMLHIRNVLRGGSYQVYFTTMSGAIVGTVNSSNKFVGFGATLFAPVNVPTDDAIHEKNLINVMFDNADEFRAAKLIKPSWNPQIVLPASVPVGLDMELVSAAAGQVDVIVTTRGGDLKTDLVVADFDIVDEGGTVTLDTATYASGQYALATSGTFTQGTIQVTVSTGPVTYVSDVMAYSV